MAEAAIEDPASVGEGHLAGLIAILENHRDRAIARALLLLGGFEFKIRGIPFGVTGLLHDSVQALFSFKPAFLDALFERLRVAAAANLRQCGRGPWSAPELLALRDQVVGRAHAPMMLVACID